VLRAIRFLLMSDRRYEFGEDLGQERERLLVLERAFDVLSRGALMEVGVGVGWRCWEVGAGRGSLAHWLAGIVGPHGEVLATDLSDQWFDHTAPGVTFQRHDVVRDQLPRDTFDLVHARFLLEHLPDPRSVIARLTDALRPGGVLVLEDAAGLELDVTPSIPAFHRLPAAWERAGRAVGWNGAYGAELMGDLRALGLREPQGRQYRQLAPGGQSWTHLILGIRRLEGQLINEGVTREEVTLIVECLADSARLVVGPPVTIAWGWRGGVG
jgi:SAM-dependent methyltransferase